MTIELMTAPVQLNFDYGLIDKADRESLRNRAIKLKSLTRRSARLAIEIGFELAEIQSEFFGKPSTNHKTFLHWLECETNFSEKVAVAYVKFAQKSAQFTDELIDKVSLAALHVLSAESTPADVIKEAKQLAKSSESISESDIKGLIKSAAHRAKGEPLFIPEQQIEVRGEGAYQNQIVTVQKIDGDMVYAKTEKGETVPFLAGEFSDSVPLPKEPGKRENNRREIEALEFEIEVLKAENQELRSIITRARSSMPDGLLKEIAEMGL